jgi:hypothetical protein
VASFSCARYQTCEPSASRGELSFFFYLPDTTLPSSQPSTTVMNMALPGLPPPFSVQQQHLHCLHFRQPTYTPTRECGAFLADGGCSSPTWMPVRAHTCHPYLTCQRPSLLVLQTFSKCHLDARCITGQLNAQLTSSSPISGPTAAATSAPVLY